MNQRLEVPTEPREVQPWAGGAYCIRGSPHVVAGSPVHFHDPKVIASHASLKPLVKLQERRWPDAGVTSLDFLCRAAREARQALSGLGHSS